MLTVIKDVDPGVSETAGILTAAGLATDPRITAAGFTVITGSIIIVTGTSFSIADSRRELVWQATWQRK